MGRQKAVDGTEEQNQGGKLRLPPVATIRDSTQLREAVLDLLGLKSPVTLDCSALEQADISTVQVILAARQMARRDGIDLRLDIPPSGVLADLIRQAGFAHEFADLWR